jgi:hypothetical protein
MLCSAPPTIRLAPLGCGRGRAEGAGEGDSAVQDSALLLKLPHAKDSELNLQRFSFVSSRAQPRDPEFFSVSRKIDPLGACEAECLLQRLSGCTVVGGALAKFEKNPGSLGCARDDTKI